MKEATILGERFNDTIKRLAHTRPDEVIFNPRDGFYSFDFLWGAYEAGKVEEIRAAKTKLKERFYDNTEEALLVIKTVCDKINEIEANATRKIFLNISLEGIIIMISVVEEFYYDDEKMHRLNSLVSKIEQDYFDKNKSANINIILDSPTLDTSKIKGNGFFIGFDVVSKTDIFQNERPREA